MRQVSSGSTNCRKGDTSRSYGTLVYSISGVRRQQALFLCLRMHSAEEHKMKSIQYRLDDAESHPVLRTAACSI